MTSHEYAEKLMQVVSLLQASPAFTVEHEWPVQLGYYGDKDKFLAAVRSVGNGTKKVDGDYLKFVPVRAPLLCFVVNRSLLCRRVQEEKWECEPLLSSEEEAILGA